MAFTRHRREVLTALLYLFYNFNNIGIFHRHRREVLTVLIDYPH